MAKKPTPAPVATPDRSSKPSPKSNVPAKRASTEVGTAFDFSRYANMGMENVTTQDVIIPRLGILQKLSPQLDKQKAKFIKGAEEGEICDLATGELFEGAIQFVPVYFQTLYLEWAPRSSGQGLKGVHYDAAIKESCEERKNDKGKTFLVLPRTGNIINETKNFYGFNVTANWRPSFIPFASTQIKKARLWNTLAKESVEGINGPYTPPLFFRSYILGSGPESNAEGSWYGWTIERGLTLDELGANMDGDTKANVTRLAQQALVFLKDITAGRARIDEAELAGDDVQGAGSKTIDHDGDM